MKPHSTARKILTLTVGISQASSGGKKNRGFWLKQFRKPLFLLEKILFFLTVFFLPTQLGKHFWPSFSAVFSLRIDYLSPTIYFWDFLVLILLLAHLLKLLISRRGFKMNYAAITIFGIFLLTQFLSLVNASNPGAFLVGLKGYFIALLFGVYVATVNLRELKKIFITALTLSVISISVIGMAQFLIGHSIGLWVVGERNLSVDAPLISKFNFYDQVFLRPYSLFPHPNMFAGFLLAVMPLFLSGISTSLWQFKIMLIFFISSTVFITFSRPAFLVNALIIVAIFKRFWKILLIFLVLASPLLAVRFSSIFTYDTLAVLRREELSSFALKTFASNPLFGVGLNNFINTLASTEVLVGTSRFLQPVHNIFLLSLSETGVIGFFGLMLLFISSFLANFRKRTPFSLSLNASLLIIIFLGLFDHYFLTLAQGQRLLFLIFGLSLNTFEEKA